MEIVLVIERDKFRSRVDLNIRRQKFGGADGFGIVQAVGKKLFPIIFLVGVIRAVVVVTDAELFINRVQNVCAMRLRIHPVVYNIEWMIRAGIEIFAEVGVFVVEHSGKICAVGTRVVG